MSDHQTYTGSLGCGPACEGDVLIVEVLGRKHPGGHTFRIFDETDQEQQEWLENRVKVQNLDGPVLHVWPWSRQPARNLWLDIEAESGDPVRVPLFRNVTETPRQIDGQWNRIWPVIPLALIHDPEPLHQHPDHRPVPLRPGFLYIFREGRLWRELEVRVTESGAPAFHDVRLQDYRQPDQPGVTEDRRPIVGVGLEAIWLPVSGMNRSLAGDFAFAFSDVQWSASRIAYLENDTEARGERCVRLKGPNPGQVAEKAGQLVLPDKLPPMRPRDPILEERLPAPWKSIYDLGGTCASNLFGQAREEQQAFAAGGESADDAWEAAHYRDARLRGAPAARLAAFEASTTDAEAPALWNRLDDARDVHATAREKEYCCLLLDDRQFRLRHHLTQALEARAYLTALLEAVEAQPHGDSARLVQQVLGPAYLGGKENPLHGYLEHIDNGYFGPLHRTLHTAQRKLAVDELAAGQQQLTGLMRQRECQSVLADYFSLQGADYIEGFALTRDVFQVLAADPNTIDTLRQSRAPVVSQAKVKEAHNLLLSIVQDGSDQPLHGMLFPADATTASSEACGDGRCRPEDLENLSRTLPETGELQTLTAAALAGVARQGDLNLDTELKRWAAGVNAALDGLDQHVRALLLKLKARASSLDARLYGPLLRLAKAREPSLLGAVQMMARSSVPQSWVILGVRDVESGLEMGLTEADRQYIHQANGHRRFYGEFYDADGKPLASTRKTALQDLTDAAEARHTQVYAAPADAEVVRAQLTLRQLKRWQDWADQVRVPYLVLVLEVWNIRREHELIGSILREKGVLRAGAGALSSLTDLGFASVMAAERLSKGLGVWQGLSNNLNKQVFRFNKTVVERASKTLAKALPEIVSRRMLGGIVTSTLTITVSTLDLIHEWDTGDLDAATAYGVSAVGGGMGLMGTFMMSALAQTGVAPVLLGLGPVGWVALGLTLAIGGGIAAALLDDPPLVDWLQRGPFGDEQDDAYTHLRDNPTETYYRLLGLLSKPRIIVEPVYDLTPSLALQGYDLPPRQSRELAQVNARVRVENNLAALLDETTLETHLRPVRITDKPTRRGLRRQRELMDENARVLLEQPLPNGKAYYLALPPRETFRGFLQSGEGVRTYTVAVRSQWQCEWNDQRTCQTLVFPAPVLNNDLAFTPAGHGQPDFGQTDRPFWADEQTHKPEEDT